MGCRFWTASFIQKQNGFLIIATESLCHYSAAWQVTRNALYFSVVKVMQILAPLQVVQRFFVQLLKMPNNFVSTSKKQTIIFWKVSYHQSKEATCKFIWAIWLFFFSVYGCKGTELGFRKFLQPSNLAASALGASNSIKLSCFVQQTWLTYDQFSCHKLEQTDRLYEFRQLPHSTTP